MKDCFNADERQELLLGVSKKVLLGVFGEPFATYCYQDKEILHYGRPELSFVEITNGVVSRCETLPERRASFRVQPLSTTNVCIITRFDELHGVIVDLSMTGMKISLTEYYDFIELEEVFLCFSLNVPDVTEKISIPGTFYRMTKEDSFYMAIFLLNYSGSEVYKKLLSFIMQIQIKMLENYQQETVS